MNEAHAAANAPAVFEPQRTDPRGLLVHALRGALQGGIPALFFLYSTGTLAAGLLFVVPLILGIFALAIGLSALRWWRFTYVTGDEDIRVEHGILSRSARSVPYDRIQDVSIEETLLPRLFGLAEIKFETGAGGKEEIKLAYLAREEGERLRELVRERRDGEAAAPFAMPGEEAGQAQPGEASELLFAMDNARLFKFGLFEFSLVIFAVLLGAAQQLDFLVPFEIWEMEFWKPIFESQRQNVEGMGRAAQAFAALAGIFGVIMLGVITGIARTFAREYGFQLERTARGFRRHRGLFNKTDVTLPVHRVQAAEIGTRLIRKRFGWHSLKFVSLARDTKGSSSHAVAPFAKLEEIWPLARRAGIEPPPGDTKWVRPMPGPWLDESVIFGVLLIAIALFVFFVLRINVPGADGTLALWGAALAFLGTVASNYFGWRWQRHASALKQLIIRKGTLVPRMRIAPQVKLQSVEIAQNPLARWRGYATMHFGLAGGTMSLKGIPIDAARRLRAEIVERIVEVDFSDLRR